MRAFLPCLVAALVAGCSSPGPGGAADGAEALPPPLPPLPPDLAVDAAMPASFGQPPVETGAPECGGFVQCHEYPLSLPRNATLTVWLGWGLEGSDLDLYVLDSAGSVQASDYSGFTRDEFIRAELEAGDYRIVVEGAYAVAESPYQLRAYVDEPRAPNP